MAHSAVLSLSLFSRKVASKPSNLLGCVRGFNNEVRIPLPNQKASVFSGEPEKPDVKTAVPGPKSKELMGEMGKYQDNRTLHFFVDYSKSKGNYVVDADGNVLLDTLCNIASMSIGYNNPALVEAAKSDEWVTALINRPALGIEPSANWPSLIEKNLMPVAPKGLKQVFTAMCGSCANEIAYKSVFMHHQHKVRGGKPFTEEEISSCMKNQAPGSPSLSIMSFTGAFHGRLFGALSTTRSKPLHKLDIPAFDWPVADFPKLKYPLKDNEAYNKAEEARCLEHAEHLLKTWHIPVAGMIVEPIQGEGGDNSASPSYFRGLRALAKKYNVAFIVDEVQTGVGVTGKFWAHEHWDLPDAPDAVTFAKKMQIAGFYHNLELRPSEGYRNFNTWMGDPIRVLQAGVILKEIASKNLVENVNVTGQYLKEGLFAIEKKFPHLISNIRGQGTYLAYDLPNNQTQGTVLNLLRQKGVEATGSGSNSIRLRPQLIFTPKHAAIYLDILYNCLKSIA